VKNRAISRQVFKALKDAGSLAVTFNKTKHDDFKLQLELLSYSQRPRS
jgi:hypothetical protein